MKNMIKNIICISLALVICFSGTALFADAGDYDTPIIPVHTHSFVGSVTTAPTCTEAGVMTYTCSCGKGTYTEPIAPLGHDMLIHDGAQETCTEPGNKPYCECRRCGNYYIDDKGENLIADKTEVVIAAKGHSFVITEQYCLNGCGEDNPDYTPAHVHQYNAVVTEPTCTEAGFTTHTCECGDSYTDTPTEALGHDWSDGAITTPATCTEAGVKTYTCRNDASHTYTEELPALGHDYKATVTKPTATALGYTTHKCSRCEDSFVNTYTAPTGKLTLKCKARTAAAETVIWNNVKTATGYQVQISTKDGKKWDKTVTLKAGVTNTTFKSLAAGNAYKFRVRFYIKTAEGNKYSPWSTTLNSPTLPAGTSFTKVPAGSRSFAAQWKKQANATGYQIEYSTKSNFSGSKKVTVKSNKTLKTTVKKLSAKKVYYVRIRTYKTIGKVNYFSTWSKAVKVKTK